MALLAAFAIANRGFLRGQMFPTWDADGLFGPYYMLIADLARHGKLLWWNPWANGGEPDFIDMQYGAHSPVVLLLALIYGPTVRGFIGYWFTLWLTFGFGLLALARSWSVPAWAGLVVALGLMFSGFFVGHAEHTPCLFSWVWMPWVLFRLEVALRDRRWSPAVQAGLLFGLSAVGGYPAIVFTNGVFLAFWILVRVTFKRDPVAPVDAALPPLPLAPTARLTALFGAVVIAVATPTFYFFFHEGKGFTTRVGAVSRDLAVNSNALHPRALLTFASPYLATLPAPQLWPYTDISSCSLYAGGLVMVFAAFALAVRPRSGFRWVLLGGAALAVTASLGQVLPVRGWLYDLVIPTRYFRHPSWFRAYPIFIFGLLALHGARDFAGLTARDAARGYRLLMAVSALAALLAGVAYLEVLDLARPADCLAGHVHFAIAWIVPALAVPWLAFLPSRHRGRVVALVFGALAVTDAVLNADLSSGTLALVGEGPRQTWADIERRHRGETDLLRLDGAMRWVSPAGPFNNKSFLTRQAALLSYSGLRNVYHERIVADPVLVVEATTADRFWYSPAPVWVAPSDAAFAAFVGRAHQLGAAPLVLHQPDQLLRPLASMAPGDPAGLQQIRTAPAAQRVPVTFQRYLPDEMRLTVTVPTGGWLMVTDRWARGWKAWIDGAAVPVAGADFIFRGLPIHAGTTHVELRYRPAGYPWAPYVLWTLVAVLLAASLWHHLPQRYRHLLRRFRGDTPSTPVS